MRGDDEEFLGIEGERSDTASELAVAARQSVGGPYRDRRDALVIQRRRIAAELDDAERSIERAERARRHLRVLDPELARASAPWLSAIAIETPCREDWSAMRGSDSVRRCERCRRDVYDLARMTRDEIEALFARADATPCVRLRRRPDGRVATADCPVRERSLASRALGVLAGAALGASTAGACAVALHAGTARPEVVHAAPPNAALAPIAAPPCPAPPGVSPPSAVPPSVDVAVLRSTPEPGGDEVVMGVPALPPPDPIGPADLEQHVRWIAPQAWEIDRALVDRVLGDQVGSFGRLRAMPHQTDGRVDGVAIYGVRPGGLLTRLGLRSGDVILDVNGYPIAMPDSALEAYSRLRTADVLFVRILRRGEELVNVYRIVG